MNEMFRNWDSPPATLRLVSLQWRNGERNEH
jgi:hypothetical protein